MVKGQARGEIGPVTDKERAWMRHYELSLNRRAEVEQVLFDVANGKRDTLSTEECWALALKLGMAGPD